MGRKPKREPSPEKPHRLTLAQLAAYDDVCTDVMVDNAYSKLFKIRKYGTNGNKYLPVRGVKEDDVPQIILHKLIVEKDWVAAERALWKLPGVRSYRLKLAAAEMADFREHFDKYVHMYKTDCPWEVSTTNRYTITTHEAAVTARRRIKQGEAVKYLVGTLVPLTIEESANLDITNRNFSIVTSARKKGSSIFLGPARFANHDCNANARLEVRGSDGMQVVAVQNIDVGEELTVSYGNDYFGPDNIDCLCHTCEVLERNGWTSHEAAGLSRSASPFAEELDVPPKPKKRGRPRKVRAPDVLELSSDTNSVPLKREYTSDDASDSAPAPAKKNRKFGPSPSKLQQSWTPPSSTTSEIGECGPASAPPPKQVPIEDIGLSTPGGQNDRPVSAHASTGSNMSPGSGLKRPTKFFQRGWMTAKLMGKSMETDSMSTPPSPPPSATPTDQSPVSLTDDKASDQLVTIIKVESVETVKLEDDEDTSMPTTLQLGNDRDEGAQVPQATATLTTTTTRKLASVLPSVEEPSIIEQATTSRLTINTPKANIRVPGDYILTRKLLAQPHDRWIKCTNPRCPPLYFVQPNGYQTRRECPRCERHSMLYGFPWPKTDPDPRKLMERKKKEEVSAYKRQGKSGKGSWVEGGGDEEERVMDHRTVHRFLFPGEEREISRKGLLKEAEEKRKELCGRLLDGFGTPDRGTESVGREASWSSTPDDGFGRRKSKRFTRDAMYVEA
jgi:[histone H4]-N-methyl-L-lysine20 N-methyltransferase